MGVGDRLVGVSPVDVFGVESMFDGGLDDVEVG